MERRTFLRWAVHGMGAVFGAVLGVPALVYLVDPRNRPRWPSREISGSANAAVLPVPVWAEPITSRPCRIRGMARNWIAVGSP